jgi:hypothetical protein
MAITALAAGTQAHTGQTTGTTVITTTTSMAVGDYCVVCVSADNAGGGGAARDVTIIDASGNTYTERGTRLADPGAANLGAALKVFTAPITVALASSSAITIS